MMQLTLLIKQLVLCKLSKMNDYLKDISSEIVLSIKEIIDDRSNGASYLSRKALGIIGRAAFLHDSNNSESLFRNIETLCKMISTSRPSMTPVKLSMLKLLDDLYLLYDRYPDYIHFKVSIQKKVAELIKNSFDTFNLTIENAKILFDKTKTVLILSKSSTINEIIKQYREFIVNLIICESRPLLEGRDTAKFSLSHGIDVTFITDCQVGLFIDRCDMVLVGADTILKNGYLINKAGTYLVALASKRANVPFYSICQTDKFSPENCHTLFSDSTDQKDIDASKKLILEEKKPDEIWNYTDDNLSIRNIYFDVTPPDLLTGIITESGLLLPEKVDAIIESNKKKFSDF